MAGLPPALSYDVHDLAGSLTAATDAMTARTRRSSSPIFDRRARPAARERKAVTEAVVNAAGLVRTQERRVVCLVLVDQLLVEGRGHDPEAAPSLVSHNRVLVTMVLRSGTWKIDGIRPL